MDARRRSGRRGGATEERPFAEWVKARYVAELHEIAARYPPGEWKIIGPPEIRDVDPAAAYFSAYPRARAVPRFRYPLYEGVDPCMHALVPRLVREVALREFVAGHVQKRWGELSEGEGNLIAREVGLAARDALSGVSAAASSHLH